MRLRPLRPTQPREVVGDAIGEGELSVDLAVEVSNGRMVVLMPDQITGDVFDFSADGHVFLWGCCVERAVGA